jgi:hypothetical protein
MSSSASRGRSTPWGRLARRIASAPFRLARLLFLVAAAVVGAPRPRFLRHEDTACLVEAAERPEE